MKKVLAVLTLAAIALTITTSPVLAGNRGNGSDNDNQDRNREKRIEKLEDRILKIRDQIREDDDDDNRFSLRGTVASVSGNNVVINVTKLKGTTTPTNNQVTVAVASDTRIKTEQKQVLSLADIKVGMQIGAEGQVNASTLNARSIVVVDNTQFTLKGTVASISGNNIVLNVTKSSGNAPAPVNNQSTVTVAFDTVYKADKNQPASLADIKVGQQLTVSGTVSGTTLNAKMVHIMSVRGKVFGEVTAKTDTTITVKNNVTGATQTVTTTPETKVTINGEIKTVADVQVGDRGFVKFKSTISGFFAKIVNLFR